MKKVKTNLEHFQPSMGYCLLFQNEKSKIEVIVKIPNGKDFDYLRPVGRTYYRIDEVYEQCIWTVFVFGLKIKRSDITFYCCREFPLFPLRFWAKVAVMILFFSLDLQEKKMLLIRSSFEGLRVTELIQNIHCYTYYKRETNTWFKCDIFDEHISWNFE